MQEPSRSTQFATRIANVVGRPFLCLGIGCIAGVFGTLLDDHTIIAPCLAFCIVLATAMIASRVNVYAWVIALPLVAMPLDSRAIFVRSLRLMRDYFAYAVAGITCIAVGLAIGAKLPVVTSVLIAWLALAAAAAMAMLLVLHQASIQFLHLCWIACAAIAFFSGSARTFAFLHDLHWTPSPLAGAALLLLAIAIACVLTYVLLPRRYTTAAILRRFEFRRPREARPDVDEPHDETSRALRKRWSARTYALLLLSTRRTDPEALVPRMRIALIVTTFAMIAAWGARLLFHTNLVFIAPPLLLGLMLIVFVTHAPDGPIRGDWRHPLIETLPVEARRYGRLIVIVNFAASAFIVLLATAAALLSPWSASWNLLAGAALLLYCSVFSLLGAISRSSVYRIDPRRTSWSRFAHGWRRFGLGAVMLLSVLLPLLPLVLWFAAWRSDARHQFDCEYDASVQPSARW